MFNQNIFTFDGDDDRPDVNLANIQPILNVLLGDRLSVVFSEMTFVYDFEADEFTSLPLGAKLSKLIRSGSGRVPIRYQPSLEHNFYNDGTGPCDTSGFTVKFLVPTGG